jgi:hypothetical protein
MCSVVSGSVAERKVLATGARRRGAWRPVFCATSAAVPLTAKRESGRTNFESLVGTAGGISDRKVRGEAVRPVIKVAILWEGAGRVSPRTRAALSLVRCRELDLVLFLGGDFWRSWNDSCGEV